MKKFLLVDLVVIALFLVLAGAILGIGLDKKFTGHHDYNNFFFANVARSYLRFGLIPLRLGQTEDGRTFYTHHPPLLPILLSGGIKILGDSERSIRLVPITFSLLTLATFYLLLRRFFTIVPAVLGMGAWIATPMFGYFGKMADHEAVTLFFIVAALLCIVLWRKSKDRRFYWLCLASMFLAQWAGWPGYYLGLVLFLMTRNWTFILLSLANFVLFITNVYWITGSIVGGGLWDILLFRMGFRQLSWAKEEYTAAQFFRQELSWSYRFFTPPVFLVNALSAGYLAISTYRQKKPPDFSAAIWSAFALIAIIHVLAFRTGAWRHDYWLYYFLPVFAWGYAMLVSRVGQLGKLILALLLIFAWWQGQPFFWALQTMIQN